MRNTECPITYERLADRPSADVFVTPCCRWGFVKPALVKWVETSGDRLCPICRAKLPISTTPSAALYYLVCVIVAAVLVVTTIGPRDVYVHLFCHTPLSSIPDGDRRGQVVYNTLADSYGLIVGEHSYQTVDFFPERHGWGDEYNVDWFVVVPSFVLRETLTRDLHRQLFCFHRAPGVRVMQQHRKPKFKQSCNPLVAYWEGAYFADTGTEWLRVSAREVAGEPQAVEPIDKIREPGGQCWGDRDCRDDEICMRGYCVVEYA